MDLVWISFTEQVTGHKIILPISAIKTLENHGPQYVLTVGPAWKTFMLSEKQHGNLRSTLLNLVDIKFGVLALD